MAQLSRRTILRTLLAAVDSTLRWISPTVTALIGFGRRSLGRESRPTVTAEVVERAIRSGVAFLKSQQLADGAWPGSNNHHQHIAGPTSLVLHALLTAGEPRDSPPVVAGLQFLEKLTPEEIDGTYSVGLQTMVFAETDPERYRVKITANVRWLESAQIKEGDNNPGWPGSWAHTSDKERRGDNSSTQFALLGLNAAAQVGVPVNPEVWARSRKFLVQAQQFDGGWPYYPNVANFKSSASMTCAGIAGLIITGQRLFQDPERLVGDTIQRCGSGRGKLHPSLRHGLDWLATHFSVTENPGSWFFRQWKHYYLYGMERVGRFSGLRFLGKHDWYREGAEELVATQHMLLGSWSGVAIERQAILATSLAVLFLATGRSPVLVNKLRHGPEDDWNNDLDDVRNLVGMVSADWKSFMTWQIVDPDTATIEDMLQAPIAYFNGHQTPLFSSQAKRTLRGFVEQGGLILAEACCGDERFDRGFRSLVREIFPEEGYELHPLDEGHAVWRAHHRLDPVHHPLWGIEHGCRTVVIYSPTDLSCFWNQMEAEPSHPLVVKAQRIGLNIVDYATGRELPADKLVVREVKDFTVDLPRRGALRIAKLRHAGDWNVAPLAIPSLTNALRAKLGIDVVINHKELFPSDPSLVHYPLIYVHGRAAVSFSREDQESLRRHVSPGGGCLFADAACGSPAFDVSFRRLIAAMFPDNPLVVIPEDDEIYTEKVGYDLSDTRYTKAAGSGVGYPQLEGVRVDGHWAVIYSRYDLGCALERHSGIDCKGYVYDSALKVAINIVIYSMQP